MSKMTHVDDTPMGICPLPDTLAFPKGNSGTLFEKEQVVKEMRKY